MPSRGSKKPYRRLYSCAEDLCDPYESAAPGDGEDGERCPKSRAHAVRLMDEIGESSDAPAECPTEKHRPAEVFGRTGCVKPEKPQGSPPPARDDASAFPWGSATGYAILSVKPMGDGDTVAVTLSVPAASEDPAGKGSARERLRLCLLVEQYADLRPQEGEISPEDAADLLAAGQFCAAVKRGMRLLQYGDQSARRLAWKLTAKGIDRENADAAAAYLARKGYIHEDDTARLRAEQDVRKLWGPRRIREDLRANGFTPEAVTEAMEAIGDVDFEETCVAAMRKKYRVVPKDSGERQKMVAALVRLGYDFETVRAAMRRMEREA